MSRENVISSAMATLGVRFAGFFEAGASFYEFDVCGLRLRAWVVPFAAWPVLR